MYERLLNKKLNPSEKELADYCEENAGLFVSLNAFLVEQLGTVKEICFPYGKKYGWCVTHRKNKKLICNVFAEAGSFTVMVRCSNLQYEKLYDQTHDYMRNYIDNKYPCGDGGWIHYRVSCQEHFEDIIKVLTMKCTMAKE